MKSHGLRVAKIAAAIAAGIWVPLRITFFDEIVPADIAIEFAVLITALFVLRSQKKELSRGQIALLVVEGLPLFTLCSPVLPNAEYLLVAKVLLFRRLFLIRDLLDGVDSMHPVLARILPLAAIVPLVIHAVACGWVFLGAGTAGISGTASLDYVKAFYWTVTTLATVGYGDISAKTPLQMIYASGTMIGGVAFFGYVLSNVAALLARMDAAKEQHNSTLDRVETFMRFNEIPRDLRTRVRAYYKYLWESRHGYDDSFVLSSLPQKLRSDVNLALNSGLISKVPLFQKADPELLVELLDELKTMTAVPSSFARAIRGNRCISSIAARWRFIPHRET